MLHATEYAPRLNIRVRVSQHGFVSGRAAEPPYSLPGPRGNSRAAKPIHQSSHGFATRVHGFATKTKALAREIPSATQATRIAKNVWRTITVISHLAIKYARIFLLGHSVFLKALINVWGQIMSADSGSYYSAVGPLSPVPSLARPHNSLQPSPVFLSTRKTTRTNIINSTENVLSSSCDVRLKFPCTFTRPRC